SVQAKTDQQRKTKASHHKEFDWIPSITKDWNVLKEPGVYGTILTHRQRQCNNGDSQEKNPEQSPSGEETSEQRQQKGNESQIARQQVGPAIIKDHVSPRRRFGQSKVFAKESGKYHLQKRNRMQ